LLAEGCGPFAPALPRGALLLVSGKSFVVCEGDATDVVPPAELIAGATAVVVVVVAVGGVRSSSLPHLSRFVSKKVHLPSRSWHSSRAVSSAPSQATLQSAVMAHAVRPAPAQYVPHCCAHSLVGHCASQAKTAAVLAAADAATVAVAVAATVDVATASALALHLPVSGAQATHHGAAAAEQQCWPPHLPLAQCLLVSVPQAEPSAREPCGCGGAVVAAAHLHHALLCFSQL